MARAPIIIEFWDVGQGDATVIRPDRTSVFLIDVGPRNSPVVQWIAHNPHLKVDGVVLTHNDADHAGAISAFIEATKFPIQRVYFLVDENPKIDAEHQQAILRLQRPQCIRLQPRNR
jgi:beta-lactamase superfamily II metal-dependent hydrolase